MIETSVNSNQSIKLQRHTVLTETFCWHSTSYLRTVLVNLSFVIDKTENENTRKLNQTFLCFQRSSYSSDEWAVTYVSQWFFRDIFANGVFIHKKKEKVQLHSGQWKLKDGVGQFLKLKRIITITTLTTAKYNFFNCLIQILSWRKISRKTMKHEGFTLVCSFVVELICNKACTEYTVD